MSSSTIRAVVAEAGAEQILTLRDVPAPTPLPNEVVVRVEAVSLNRGEVRMSRNPRPNWRPGWDFAGVVETPAADGTGLQAGTRVVGIARSGAWAEQVVVPTDQIAALPDAVTFAQAATLPVAGLTALHALTKGGFLLEQTVLITGATGGVGDFAIQLAKRAGAKVVANVRRPDQEGFVRDIGADEVVIGETLNGAEAYKPYTLILDSVGGATLGAALGLVEEGTKIITFGTSAGSQVTFDAATSIMSGGTMRSAVSACGSSRRTTSANACSPDRTSPR